MYMNGAVIGLLLIHLHRKPILPDHHQDLTACSEVVTGSAVLRSAACRLATAMFPAPSTSTAGSVWLAIYRLGIHLFFKLKDSELNNSLIGQNSLIGDFL